MMLYLTSHIGGSIRIGTQRIPAPLMTDNGLTDSLKAHWPDAARVLVMSSAPEDDVRNDMILGCFAEAFPMSGLKIKCMHSCDARSESLAQQLRDYDVIILSGGHVPTQNAFFEKIRLKEWLCGYRGIVIGISAGTMNSAEVVYAQPELPGETSDLNYRRFIPGLGLTRTMVLPHWQALRGETLDGLRICEDLTLPDSIGRTFYALCDGSYILSQDGVETLHGEAYRIHDGEIEQICKNGQSILI